jgi:hypothetical protein
MKRLLLGPLVALITSFLCLGITLLFAQFIKSPDAEPANSEPISLEAIDTHKLYGRHFDDDFVTGACLLHQVPFKRDKAETYSGSSLSDQGYAKAREELFPNSSSSSNGPTAPGQETYSLIQYCEKCREAEARWIKAHKER